jgi:uncharacterized protein YndB with AHSA1/START domain
MSKVQRIEKQVLLRAPRSRVWQALVDYKQFSAWFGHELIDPIAPGAVVRARVKWENKDGIEPFFKVEAIEPERRFAFRWVPDEMDPALPYEQQAMTLVEFVLTEVEDGTLLTHSESGYDKIPHAKREWLFRNDRGWTEQMRNIERYIAGKPDEISTNLLEVKLEQRIAAPVSRVHEAIVDPARMRNYFISRGSARMQPGTTVEWEWTDVGAKAHVDVIEVTPTCIVFDWSAADRKSRVTMTLTADGDATKLAITEAAWRMTSDGVKTAMGQMRGWTDFVCSLKGYLVHGINLRTGARVEA